MFNFHMTCFVFAFSGYVDPYWTEQTRARATLSRRCLCGTLIRVRKKMDKLHTDLDERATTYVIDQKIYILRELAAVQTRVSLRSYDLRVRPRTKGVRSGLKEYGIARAPCIRHVFQG